MLLPKISIVTPSFNQGQFLEETIQSVLGQNYPNLEYIIMDGGSTDNSVEIIKKYVSQITYWESKPDKGQSDAINKGLSKCTGEIFNWLNSDDLLEAGSLFKISKVFQESNVYLVSGKCQKFGKGFKERIIPEDLNKDIAIEEKLLSSNYIQPSTFIHTTAIKEIGLPNEQLHYCMDYEWYLRFLLCFGIEKCQDTDVILSRARMHHESKTLSFIEKFRTDRNSILFQLSKQLDLPSPLLDQIASLGMLKSYEQKWQINIKFDKVYFAALLSKEINPYINDPSYIYRHTADYMFYYGNQKNVVNTSVKALLRQPFKLINYKYLTQAILNTFRKTP